MSLEITISQNVCIFTPNFPTNKLMNDPKMNPMKIMITQHRLLSLSGQFSISGTWSFMYCINACRGSQKALIKVCLSNLFEIHIFNAI